MRVMIAAAAVVSMLKRTPGDLGSRDAIGVEDENEPGLLNETVNELGLGDRSDGTLTRESERAKVEGR